MATAASPASTTRIIWFWQSNSNPWDDNEVREWQRYSDLEIDFVEREYQNSAEQVELGDYIIDFKQMLQYKKGAEHRQRRVKREKASISNYLREERFAFVPHTSKSFKKYLTPEPESEFLRRWAERNADVKPNGCDYNYTATINGAIKGILHEGRLLDKEFEAQLIADQLEKVKGKTPEEIQACCIHLFTMESFLYKLINTTLKNEDYSKLDTLGPYCWILWCHTNTGSNFTEFSVYRGCTLTDGMIADYKEAVDTKIKWPSVTSTSRSRQMAEQFGNTLFVIRITDRSYNPFRDISLLSHYPNEEEVLLKQGFSLKVDKVEYDEKNKKYVIYATNCF